MGDGERMASEAALALHAPGLTASEVTDRLLRLLDDLGLCEEAAFHAPGTTPPELEEGTVLVPLRGHGGGDPKAESPLGVLLCRPKHPSAEPVVELLAGHAGAALASIAHQAEVRRVAERLQDLLLPPVPSVRHSAIEVRYRAAAREARVGGDFYDVFPLPDSRVLLTVGDVMGKGIEAAGRTSLITHTMRALALQGLGLSELLDRLDQQVSFQDPDVMATVWCGLYDPDSGELDFASLGHPPALLVRADAEPIHLTLEGLPLGLRDLSETPPEVRSRELHSRDLLVLYTDGLVEASGDYTSGQQALQQAVATRHHVPLDTLLDDVMDELLADAGHSDDTVMLALRRR